MPDLLLLRRLLEQRNILTPELEACFLSVFAESSNAWLVADRNGAVLFANIAAERLFARESQSLAAQPFPLPLEDGLLQEVTIGASHDDGLIVQLEAAAITWRGAPAYLVTLRDSTAQKERELRAQVHNELDKSRGRDHLLLLQSRSAATGEMIGNIAHQWRQPLTTISLLIQDIRECYVYGEFSKEYLDTTVGNALNIIQHMSQTIDDFRNFFRQDKEKQAFSVREVIERSLSFIAASLRYYGVTVEVAVDDNLIIHGLPNEFSQVLLNIIGNAKDIFRERNTATPRIRIEGFREDKRTVITITDNGGGIAEDVMDHIFEPYFTTRTAGNGTGLGLSMSKTIIEKNMDGTLTACNVPGGAQFRVEV